MSSSAQRNESNCSNALKSTGPTSGAGKAVSCQNARRHGVFSARLCLEDEDPSDFELLQLDLQATLSPLGTIELALVERIAITMWRQQRLVSAETASLTLHRHDREVARKVSSTSGFEIGDSVSERDLQPFDLERIDWCNAVIGEIEALDEITLQMLKERAPYVWQQLVEDAETDDETPEAQVAAHEQGVTGYVMELYQWCKSQLSSADDRPKLLALAQQLKQKHLVLPLDQLQLFARYQTTLDNQLYKALKALREAQEWRLKSLDATSNSAPVMQNKAA